MKPILSIILLIIPVPSAIGQVINHYKIDAELLPEDGMLRADAMISVTVPQEGLRNISFLLNRGLDIDRLSCTATMDGFHLDRDRTGEYRHTNEMIPLVIYFRPSLFPGEEIDINLTYEGAIEPDPQGINRLSREWVELGSSSAWFPFNPDYTSFAYDVDIKIDGSYGLTGTGTPTFSDGKWRLSQSKGANDIILIGSQDLKIKSAVDAQVKLHIAHAGLNEDQLKRITSDALDIADQFTRWFRTSRTTDTTIVFAKRSRGGGYSRPGLAVTLFDGTESGYQDVVKILTREIAHFWWCGAPTSTWEDWLNESFAEYAALMLIRERDGEEAFSEYMEKLTKASTNTPALWGFNRNDEDAYGVLYQKGPLILHRLEQEIGWDKFFRFLILLIDRKVESTAQLLDILESITSRSVRDNFEAGLKQQ